jgi:hypothetical protein
MTKNSINMEDLAHRLENLETNKSRRWLFGPLLTIIIIVAGFRFTTILIPKEIVAEKINIVDKLGIIRLKMEIENGDPQITLTYENGDPCLRMSGGELRFYDQDKKARINIKGKDTLNSSYISITDPTGKKCLNLSVSPEGPYLNFEDKEEQKEVVLCIDPIGSLNLIERSSGKRLPREKVACPPIPDRQVTLE